jgi:hypothetical protein
MGELVRNYRRIPPGVRILIMRSDKNLSSVLYFVISSIKPQSRSTWPETHKRGGIKKYKRTNIHPRGRGKKKEKKLRI